MSEELPTAQELRDQHRRDANEVRWAERISKRATEQLGEAAVENSDMQSSPEREPMDIANTEHALERAQNFATFEAERVQGAHRNYDEHLKGAAAQADRFQSEALAEDVARTVQSAGQKSA